MKIGIAWPHTMPFYHKHFVESIFCMARPKEVEYALLIPNSDGPLDGIRNELCQQALLMECDKVLWCDTDQRYPQDTLMKLLAPDLPIVAAKVHRRKAPYDALLKRRNPDRADTQNPMVDIPDDEWAYDLKDSEIYPLVEVDATGFGCNLMDISVLQSIKRPWFKFDLYSIPTVGEDIYFWQKVKAAGWKIYVDVSIDIGHIATAIVNSATYFEFKKQSMG